MIIPEAEYKAIIFDKLYPYFHVKKEVTGYFFGNRCRIDAVITPKDNTQWANKNISFGVEFKHFSENYEGKGEKSANLGYYAKQFKQIIDYSYTVFNDYGRLPILICPPLFNNMGNMPGSSSALQLIKNCMGQCNVGELCIDPRTGLTIYFNTLHRIWSERYGIGIGKTQQFLIKTGSGSPVE